MSPVSPPGGAIRKNFNNNNNNGKDTLRTDIGTVASSSVLSFGSDASRPWSPAHIYQEIAGYSTAGSASGTAAGAGARRLRGSGNNADGDKGTRWGILIRRGAKRDLGICDDFPVVERAIRQMTIS